MNTTHLRWACRRGMLELDLILLPFFDACYAGLSQEEQALFAQLLTFPDPVIFTWCMGEAEPEDPAMAAFILKIRKYAIRLT